MYREQIAERNPDALLADGLEAALVGVTVNTHHPTVAVYDVAKCVQVLVGQGMSEEEADEYLCFNTFCAYVGENGPLLVEMF